MKKIRTKITVPFLNIIIIIPVITLILFNIALRIYFTRTAVQDLKNTVASVEVILKNQAGENLLNNQLKKTDPRLVTVLGNLRVMLKVSKLAANTEFMLFDRNLDVVYPVNLKSGDTFITDKLVAQIRNVLPNARKNKVYTIKSGGSKYILIGNKLTQASLPGSHYMVFISSTNNGMGVIRTLNFILILILLIAVLISSSIAFGVSKSISKPIINLGSYAQRIGKGEFTNVPIDRSSEEIYELSLNMNEMSQRLLNSSNSQKAFLQNASHELRTPLMSIQGYAEGIIKGVFPDTEKAAGIIRDESIRLNTLVEELLTLSHIENKTYASEPTKLNLSHMIREYVQRVNGLALRENKKIITDIKEDNILVIADDKLLSQAVINIISNCIRYAKNSVTVNVCRKDNNALIRIGDDGQGIDEGDLPHIFERFYKGKNGNFGLGLSIAKLAVEYNSGTISAFNASEGAVFEISLPILAK